MLTVAEAQGRHEYFRRCADAFTKVGDSSNALICAKAQANIRQELWKSGIMHLR